MPLSSGPKLSICIPTLNRAAFIGASLETILPQLTDECEVVVLDGASNDSTEQVVSGYARRCSGLRYIRQDKANGFDADCDGVVQLARGEYCWLMADDDFLKPGAVLSVLTALGLRPSLVVVNVEARSFDMSRLLQPRWLAFEADRMYEPRDMERLLVDAAAALRYFGCVIIRREIWLARERRRYYGSWFTYLAVIFQEQLPGKAVVIAEPLISYRKGNEHAYSTKLGDIWFNKLPSVIASLPTLSDSTKNKFWSLEPWKNKRELLRVRAIGAYSLTEYRRWVRPRLRTRRERLAPAIIALLPGVLVNAMFLMYYSVTQRSRGVWQPAMELASLRESRYHFRNWQPFRRFMIIRR